jgi:sialidase-1
MKVSYLSGLLMIPLLLSCAQEKENVFWQDGQEFFDVQPVFADERFPSVVVALDGTVIATWGNSKLRVRRSEDGGNTWGPEITVADPGFQGGGAIVDETTGDVLVFVEEAHPISPVKLYRSSDHGLTWQAEELVIHPDQQGHIPSMHMNESGISLRHGPRRGRLIRATRFYGGGNDREFWPEHYTNAMYSDDGGKSWHTSAPFPAMGTGEAALAELADGTIYYNSRRHLSTDGRDPRRRHIAWSYNQGETWENLTVSEELPDGDQSRDYGLMAGLVRLPVEGHDLLLFSNIESQEGRNHGTVWASFDGGKTWPVKRLVEEGSFAYSSMAAGRAGTPSEGQIFLFYESDGGAKMARFNLIWLTAGRDWREFLPSASTVGSR